MRSAIFASFTAAILAAGPALAVDWELNAQKSIFAVGTISNGDTGETHRFTRMSGVVTPAGAVTVAADLTSLSTGIEMRDDLIDTHVVTGDPIMKIRANVDPESLNAIPVGEGITMELGAIVSLMDRDIPVYLDVYVLRVEEWLMMVSSETPTYVSFEELGINDGVDILAGVGAVDTITRVTPVTFRLLFEGF